MIRRRDCSSSRRETTETSGGAEIRGMKEGEEEAAAAAATVAEQRLKGWPAVEVEKPATDRRHCTTHNHFILFYFFFKFWIRAK